ncbi:hypothetical protein HS1genome_1265 [Sulfodiicoccus acidiphilus]|uniref:Uncharacterized protein n=1 Tax=Sulfodiicoccus acidiphilus TaxID=1670455 RepID=A0A348B3X4_9CREN|nr:hypothetical protein [Sulfodiicoccus acidiphilus]BBD72876.1 hypothetical protein HS1genome_1265 [Sulfodiicoccus acidiphilus]GGT88312.1 hypothetical protein GCM10007116_02870 [Sulfodiicoccus acidiphilus]
MRKARGIKRAGINFFHKRSVDFIRSDYLKFRIRSVEEYFSAVKNLRIELGSWVRKLFPFKDDTLKLKIRKEATGRPR